jgi:hypothetical protein
MATAQFQYRLAGTAVVVLDVVLKPAPAIPPGEVIRRRVRAPGNPQDPAPVPRPPGFRVAGSPGWDWLGGWPGGWR